MGKDTAAPTKIFGSTVYSHLKTFLKIISPAVWARDLRVCLFVCLFPCKLKCVLARECLVWGNAIC